MIRTWVADVSPLMKEQTYQRYYSKVPEFRQQKADKFHFMKDKAQSVGAWILYMEMCHAYGLSEEAVFNLSHSGSYVLCSIADGEEPGVRVGSDIEGVKELQLKIAKRFFCPNETGYIESQGTEKEQAEAFYRYWVLKESFMKATRLGMGLDMQSFEIQINKDGATLIRQPEEIKEHHYYMEYKVDSMPMKMAVCSTSRGFDKLKVYTLFD